MEKFKQSNKNKDEEKEKQIEKHLKILEKYEKISPLEMTARDHKIIGSSLLPEMVTEPDKTWAELMTNEEILAYLKKEKEDLEECLKNKDEENCFTQNVFPNMKRKLKLSIEYLKQIGRLPKEFEDFE